MVDSTDKTIIMNTSLSNKFAYKKDVLVNNISISPAVKTKFLGVIIDNKLNFNSHIDFLVSKCNSRLYLMRKLKTLGLDSKGLKTFY